MTLVLAVLGAVGLLAASVCLCGLWLFVATLTEREESHDA